MENGRTMNKIRKNGKMNLRIKILNKIRMKLQLNKKMNNK